MTIASTELEAAIELRYPGGETSEHLAAASSLLQDRLIRVVDVLAASLLLLALLPLMLLIAAGCAAGSGGGVLFAHTRVGLHGRLFPCLKFRTMIRDADRQLEAILRSDPALRAEWERDRKLRRDPRVTPIGRLLRITSLDELPQLINVVRGEMSLVGPRPIVKSEVALYGRNFHWYCRVRPGLTGLWQISGRNDTTYRRRVALDVAFVRRRSIGLYLLILARTPACVLLSRGCY